MQPVPWFCSRAVILSDDLPARVEGELIQSSVLPSWGSDCGHACLDGVAQQRTQADVGGAADLACEPAGGRSGCAGGAVAGLVARAPTADRKIILWRCDGLGGAASS